MSMPGPAVVAGVGGSGPAPVADDRPGPWGRAVAGVVVVALAVEVAVVECFMVPLRAGRWPLPVCVLAAVVGNVVLARLAVRLTGLRWLGVLPPLIWLAVVLVLAAPRPEGDLVVPGSWVGLAFLFGGAVAGAYGAASAALPPRRRAAMGGATRG